MREPLNRADRPIGTPAADRLERGPFIRALMNAVVSAEGQATGLAVGLTGPWGSGKSSILNLLEVELESAHPDAIVVRFNPWLFEGTHELVGHFFTEIAGTLNSRSEKLKDLVSSLANYGALLSPALDFAAPGLGALLGGTLGAAQKRIESAKSLNVVRQKTSDLLLKRKVSIVVLIDDLDRLDDEEIRTVARLVRSVADFPNISYVLAYDLGRVIEALGGRGTRGRARGMAFLEKIIQKQVALPALSEGDLRRLLRDGLEAAIPTDGLRPWGVDESRWDQLLTLIFPGVISTPRDLLRAIGEFSALVRMTDGEVDLIDLFGFSALAAKAPDRLEAIRQNPESVVVNPVTERELTRRMLDRIADRESARSGLLLPEGVTPGSPTDELYVSLFPTRHQDDDTDDHPDRLRFRRPLLTALYLGLPSSFSPRRKVLDFLALKSIEEIVAVLNEAKAQDRLDSFLDRLEEVFPTITDFDDQLVWRGFSHFLRKETLDWERRFTVMPGIVDRCEQIIYRSLAARPAPQRNLAPVLDTLLEAGDLELAPRVVRSHSFQYGLFGRQARGTSKFTALSECATEGLMRQAADRFRRRHLGGGLLPALWTLHAVYLTVDVGLWDEECRAQTTLLATVQESLDGLTVLLFGGRYTTDRGSLDKLMNAEEYLRRSRERLNELDANLEDPSLVAAYRKALGDD